MPVEAPIESAAPCPLPEGFLPSNCTYAEKDWPVLARQWFPVCRADEAFAKPRQVLLLNLRLVVYRMAEGIRVGRDRCPHRGLSLSNGHIEADEFVCAYHGLRFGPEGQCRKVPHKLAPKTVDCFRITLFPAVERHGLVWTCLIPDGKLSIPDVLSGSAAGETDDPSSSFKPSDEALVDALKLRFSDNSAAAGPFDQQSLQDLVLAEYQRLLSGIGSGSAKGAIHRSGT